jgi:hypothetical protein
MDPVTIARKLDGLVRPLNPAEPNPDPAVRIADDMHAAIDNLFAIFAVIDGEAPSRSPVEPGFTGNNSGHNPAVDEALAR